MLGVAVVGGNAASVPLSMAYNYAVRKRVKVVFFAKESEKLNRRFVCTGYDRLCGCSIGASKRGAARIFDTSGLAHFYTDMRIIRAAAAVPTSEIPR